MNLGKIADLLAVNGIEESVFLEKLYRALLLSVFEVVCKEIKKQGVKTMEKENFRKFKNKVIPTRGIVARYAGCQLPDEDYAEMARLLTAFFRTGSPRKKFQDDYREQLIKRQAGQCAICHAPITAKGAHLDHIVPWEYVGDNLEDNYQMLCGICNQRKGTAAYFEFSMLLLNKSSLRTERLKAHAG